MRPKVLLCGDIVYATESWKALSIIAEIVEPRCRDRAEFVKTIASGTLDGVFAIYRTFESVETTGRFDAEVISLLPRSVKFICHNGAGYDQIDVHACAKKGIKVSNAPGVVDDCTADTAMFLILGALRRLNLPMTTLRGGAWRGSPLIPMGHNPQTKVLGILGMGGIGQTLRRRAEAFGMQILYNNRRRLSQERTGSAVWVTFEDLLACSDVISVNLPLNTETRHIISAPQFDLMREGVTLVNTARGAIIDEQALINALGQGKVACVGLDVYEDEPNVHPDLLNNPNVMLLPHMGTWSVETQAAMEEKTILNLRSALERGVLKNPVPEHATAETKRTGSAVKGVLKR